MKWRVWNDALKMVRDVVASHVDEPLEAFLNPKRDPYIKGLQEVSKRLLKAVAEKQPIRIIGDYDADGVMSTFILYTALRETAKKNGNFWYEPQVRFPRRFTEGYGLSVKAVEETEPGTLLICVDNGIAALDAIKEAKKKGLEVIIIDHHLRVASGELPEADLICDPNAIEGSEFNDYCAAGLSYRIAKEMLGENEKLAAMNIAASIATVTDVVKLHGDNRNILISGLEAANNRKGTLGMNTLLDMLHKEHVTEEDYGFYIGPMFNAAGRLEDDGPMEAFSLLIADIDHPLEMDAVKKKAEDAVKRLIELNEKRKSLVDKLEAIAESMIYEQGYADKPYQHKAIVLFNEEFHDGVNGILAGHLAEKYGMPSIVFSKTESGILKGSGRTVGDIHLKNLLDQTKDLLLGYGGHAGAAGVAIQKENLEAFQSALDVLLKDHDPEQFTGYAYYDLEISVQEIPYVIRELHKYAPYGEGNPPLTFKIRDFETSARKTKNMQQMQNYVLMKKKHLKLFGKDIDAIGFSMAERFLSDGAPKHVEILGNLTENYFNGNIYNQISMIDYREPKEERAQIAYMELEPLLEF